MINRLRLLFGAISIFAPFCGSCLAYTRFHPLTDTEIEYKNGYVPKVYFGHEADISKFPWQAVLLSAKISDNYKAQFCGAVIVSAYWLLTAAHCFDENTQDRVEVLSGTDVLDNSGEKLRNKVDKVYIYWRYKIIGIEDNGIPDYDLALIKVKSALAGKAVDIDAPPPLLGAGTMANISGFGRIQKGARAHHLQAGMIEVISKEACSNVNVWGDKLDGTMICAGNPLKRDQAAGCDGDSGGPLTIDNSLIGVISWGPDKCGTNSTVFVKVEAFLSDIKSCVSDEASCRPLWQTND